MPFLSLHKHSFLYFLAGLDIEIIPFSDRILENIDFSGRPIVNVLQV